MASQLFQQALERGGRRLGCVHPVLGRCPRLPTTNNSHSKLWGTLVVRFGTPTYELHVIPDSIRNPERFLEASVRWYDNKAARPTYPP